MEDMNSNQSVSNYRFSIVYFIMLKQYKVLIDEAFYEGLMKLSMKPESLKKLAPYNYVNSEILKQ